MLFTELQCFSDLFCVGFFLSSHNLSSICYSITRQSDVGNPFYFCEFISTVFFSICSKMGSMWNERIIFCWKHKLWMLIRCIFLWSLLDSMRCRRRYSRRFFLWLSSPQKSQAKLHVTWKLYDEQVVDHKNWSQSLFWWVV